MPRNMSFLLTTDQVRARTKTVTRRLGWTNLKVGEVFNLCERCQGLKKGERVTVLAQGRCTSNTRELLLALVTPKQRYHGRYTLAERIAEVVKEGFPHLTPEQFVTMFCEHMNCRADQPVRRIEFEYL